MYVVEARKHFDMVAEKDRKKCVFIVSKNAGKFLQIPPASYWKEELGNVWVLDESGKNAELKEAELQNVFESDSKEYTEKVYDMLAKTGNPLTVHNIKKKIGGGITVNDVIRSINKLAESKLVCGVKTDGSFDKYMLK